MSDDTWTMKKHQPKWQNLLALAKQMNNKDLERAVKAEIAKEMREKAGRRMIQKSPA